MMTGFFVLSNPIVRVLHRRRQKGGDTMAKTKTSTYGKQHQKIVPVRSYIREGKRVRGHRRSTPN